MYPCALLIDGVSYRSVEHYYQSMKTISEDKRKWIRESATGYEAKNRARSLNKGEKFTKTPGEKAATMRRAFFAKFLQNKDLAQKLVDTGDAVLLEASPDDLFWGEKGENWIGKVVMEVRAHLIQNQK